jgi:hypothetical protein
MSHEWVGTGRPAANLARPPHIKTVDLQRESTPHSAASGALAGSNAWKLRGNRKQWGDRV